MKSWFSLVRTALVPLCVMASVVACSSDDPTDTPQDIAADAKPVLENYAKHLQQAYADSAKDAEALKVKLQALIASPSQATLDAARTEWLNSRRNYMLTEGARFYEGPIDVEPENPEYLLNGWPLDEAYIDYVVDGPTRGDESLPGEGGIIADTSVPLTPAELEGRNGEGGEENISSGYHAIEFLLWGQVTKDVGPGERPFTDYDPNDPVRGTTAVRRGEFLIAAIDAIIARLNTLADAWKEGATYREEFLANKDNESVSKALSGFGKLSRGEMAGERINAGLESKARRDQHNCFSSTTFIDYERDARGILDFYQGNYNGDDGPGFDDLVAKGDKAVNDKLLQQLNATIADIKAINVPFEEAIQGDDTSPNRVALIKVREDFRTQGSTFGEAAGALGIQLTIPDEN